MFFLKVYIYMEPIMCWNKPTLVELRPPPSMQRLWFERFVILGSMYAYTSPQSPHTRTHDLECFFGIQSSIPTMLLMPDGGGVMNHRRT
jgi:hypothetical protein